MRAALIGMAVVAGTGILATAQQPRQIFRSTTDVVHMDVSVLDGDRQPVRGLTQADFTILEGGVRQPIVAFEEVKVAEATAVSAPWMRDVASDVVTNNLNVRRVVVVIFDDAHIPLNPWAISSAKRIARDVVERLGPDDLAAVTFTWRGRKQDVTSDRSRLVAAIESFMPHPGTPTRAGSIAIGPSPPPCSYRGKYRSIAGCAIDALTNAAEALAEAPPGRKTLVYISNGIPFDFLTPGPDSMDEAATVRDLFRVLQRANATVYTVDPVGLEGPGEFRAEAGAGVTPGEDKAKRMDSMRMLAEETGGRWKLDSNAPWEAVPQIFRENSSYYLIGFQPTNVGSDGRFRPVQVRVNRPGVEVRTRTGYYEPAPSAQRARTTAGPVRVSPAERALSGPLPTGPLTFRATAAPVFVSGQRDPALVVAIGLREPSMGRAVSRTVNTTATAFGDDWKPQATAKNGVTISFPAATGRDFAYDVVSTMPARPGRYQLRIGAEVGGDAGSVFVDVDVPDFSRARLALSGLVLAIDPRIAGVSTPEVASLLPVTPTTVREFKSGQRVSAFLRVVQGGNRPPASVEIHTSIVDGSDQARVGDAVEMPAARFISRSADYTYVVPTTTLAPGPHLLTIEATLGATTVRRTARFTMR